MEVLNKNSLINKDYFFIDTHAHLDMIKGMTPEFAVQESLRQNVKYIINVGSSISGSKKSSEYARQFDNVFASVGIHPHYVENFNKEKIKILQDIIKNNPKIVAVGETGFDYFRNLSPKDDQKRAFEMHIELAQNYKLPLIVHDRDAHDDILNVLKYYYSGCGTDCSDTKKIDSDANHKANNEANGNFKVVIHCFSGNTDFALKCIDLGFYISFTGVITFPNAKSLAQTVKEIPIERIFIETDAPFLAPQEKRGKENYPGYVVYVAKKISEIKKLSLEYIAMKTSNNALNFFNIK